MKIEVKVFILLMAFVLTTRGVDNYIAFNSFKLSFLSTIALIALAGMAARIASQTVTKPLQKLTNHASEIRQDLVNHSVDLEPTNDLKPALHDQNEFSALAHILQQLEVEFGQVIETLQQTTAIKERMESDLNIGRHIQMNLLTLTLPAFPKRKNLDLYATLKPAREVGGDFYDFYFFREDKSYLLEANSFCFCIGDVSGKGVPAAFFMAVTKTLLKSQANKHLSPAVVLTHVNQVLSTDNPSCMFVTLFFGVLNLTNGELVYTNAGHNPPYVRRGGGSLETLDQGHGPALGIMEDFVYQESRTTLETDDILIAYTDGVTEAMDQELKLFSEERFTELLASGIYQSAEEVINLTIAAVSRFQGDAEQSDDLTMLSMRFLGQSTANEKERLELSIKKGILSKLRDAQE